jgi:hypothetical protein
VSINIVVNCPGFGQIIGVKPLINVSAADDLEASVVLKKTLLAILSIPNIQLQNIFTFIEQNFQSAVPDLSIMPDPTTGQMPLITIFNLIYREILFKGVGDLFQEINSVAKFGGYTMQDFGPNNKQNYFCTDNRLSYNASGDQTRCFLANDRPSGTRFIYMLLNGREDQINNKAFGGYYSKEREVLAKRSNYNICSTHGGKRRKRTKKISKRNKKKSYKVKRR